MEKKTYKDLKDGDTVYIVNGADVFEELTIKIREVQYHPRNICSFLFHYMPQLMKREVA